MTTIRLPAIVAVLMLAGYGLSHVCADQPDPRLPGDQSAASQLVATDDDDDEKEERVKLADCPKPVQKTLKRESKGGKIEEIVREKEDGKIIYEAEIELDGKEYEVEVAEDGTLLSKVLEDDDDDD